VTVSVQFEMKCKHLDVADLMSLQPIMLCKTCARHLKVIAVECREYKWKCRNCRVARYTGANVSLATREAAAHQLRNSTHDAYIDGYVVVESKKRKMNAILGNRVKPWIIPEKPQNVAQRFVRGE
jgi:hypothetical protein